ncbi:MAG TPA: ATP-binding cassette domain-containing protein [Solirubrobacteraceae bacterium]|nr:ATP-binding cassette domain-containing protein [Solirubrobacteraceae bacterium]
MSFDQPGSGEERPTSGAQRWVPGGHDEPAPFAHAEQPGQGSQGEPREMGAAGSPDREADKEGLLESAYDVRERRPPVPEGHDASEHETAAGSDVDPTHALPAQGNAQSAGERSEARGSRVSVVDEQPPRPEPPDGASADEYQFHTYKVYPSGRPDTVEFIDVYKAFGRARILRGLNMGLPEGMVSMILGPSGTGKSVCIKHMVGLLYPDRGDVLVHGESVPNMADEQLFEMRKKFGLLFQDGALFGSMNLFDNVAFPLRQHTEKGEDEIEDIVMRRLNEVGLGDAREKMPNELSGGMRKRAGFARALVLEPDIVLFDEPDSGLDPVRTALLGELILEIHRDMMDDAKAKGKEHLPTFAVITHDIMSARRVADYINVLWRGRIVEAGPAEDMLNSENPFIRQFLAGESQGPLSMD